MKGLVVALGLVLVQAGAAKPDFSGTWEADLGASQTGQMTYSRMGLVLTHGEPKLTVRSEVAADFGAFSTELVCTTDGSPCTARR